MRRLHKDINGDYVDQTSLYGEHITKFKCVGYSERK